VYNVLPDEDESGGTTVVRSVDGDVSEDSLEMDGISAPLSDTIPYYNRGDSLKKGEGEGQEEDHVKGTKVITRVEPAS
jgi:hypothetical protein